MELNGSNKYLKMMTELTWNFHQMDPGRCWTINMLQYFWGYKLLVNGTAKYVAMKIFQKHDHDMIRAEC